MSEQDNPFDLIQSLNRTVDLRSQSLTDIQKDNFEERKRFWVPAFLNVLGAVKAGAMSEEEASAAIGEYTAIEAVLRRVDSLTQLWSKEAINEIGESAFNHAISAQEAFTVAMIDLDKFKDVNDTYGHATGDELLRKFSRITSGLIRNQDILGRDGGEEFLLIMPDLTQEEAKKQLETIRQEVEQKLSSSISTSQINHPLTVSIGFAEYEPGVGLSFERLKHHADTALYIAKGKREVEGLPIEGRNRVVPYLPKYH